MKFTKDDNHIIHAALVHVLEGDEDPWDDLTGDDLDRAAELLEELADEIDENPQISKEGDDEEEEEEEDDDIWPAAKKRRDEED